jgi:peptide subunit release factor 1 (eRF1)
MNTTELLINEIKSHGMAVAGPAASLQALKTGQADLLVLAKDYKLSPGWGCKECQAKGYKWPKKHICPVCGHDKLKKIDLMEELVKTAEKHDCMIETVAHNDALKELGGAGCLLRYLTPEQYETGFYNNIG